MTSFLPSDISGYGAIGNCRTAALISRGGSIDWCCFPKFDSPSYFGRLLDPAGGHFVISPNAGYQSEQSYLPDTNVLETRFTTATGRARLTDFFSVRRGDRTSGLWPDQEILRIVEGDVGEVELRMEFAPKANYGLEQLRLKPIGNWGLQCNHGRKLLLLQTSLSNERLKLDDSGQAQATFVLRPDEKLIFSLSYADEAPAVLPPLKLAGERKDATVDYWKSWSGRCQYSGPFDNLVRRSALALKLLNFAPSGAFIAAPTTSLPEIIGGSRNWDYRFCWLRDASFTTRALISLGYIEEAKSFLNWLLHSTRLSWPKLQVLYSVYGEAKVQETTADWLKGFMDSRPVRLGNLASAQIQLDVYGEVIDSFFSLSPYLDTIDKETKKMVIGFGRSVAKHWLDPDQGIWEARTGPAHYTHSKLMCWVAMDRMAKLAERFHWHLPYDANRIATAIRTDLEARAFDEKSQGYTRSYGESELDASLLVMPLVGYCDVGSVRFQTTQQAIIRQLSRNNFVFRYRPGSDGVAESEGAFAICNFWLSENLANAGRIDEALKWFEAVTRCLPTSQLASEEIDSETGRLLGNYPQGFSHIGLINAALAIGRLSA